MIKNVIPTKTKKGVCNFIGMDKHYRAMWARGSHNVQPLNRLKSNNVKLKWTVVYYTYFNKRFNIHTDTSNLHLGDKIIQEDRSIKFYRQKIRMYQKESY